MKKIKIFFAAFMMLFFTIFISEKAYAEVEAYLVTDKETGITYNYSSKGLKDALIDSALGLDASLWTEFDEKSKKHSIHAIYHDSGKFVPYSKVEQEYIKRALENELFDLDIYVEKEAPAAEDIPVEFANFAKDKERVIAIFKDDVVLKSDSGKKLVIEGDLYIAGNNTNLKDIVIKGSLVLSPGSKGKATIDGVAAEKIEILSGAENGIKFNKVEAKVLKVKEELKNPVTGMETSKIEDTDYKPSNPNSNGSNSSGGDNSSGNNPDPVDENTIKASVSKTERNSKEINLTLNVTNISGEYITIAIYDKATNKLCYIDQTKKGTILNKAYSFTTVLDKANYEVVIKDSSGKSIKISF